MSNSHHNKSISCHFASLLTASVAALLFSVVVQAAEPVFDPPRKAILNVPSQVSDQNRGSVLFYNIFTSLARMPDEENTLISITNTNNENRVTVHFFFVDNTRCAPADTYLCLTSNQTIKFTASDSDPGTRGYLVGFAVDPITGLAIPFDWLVGDEYVNFATGHSANLAAEAINVAFLPFLNFTSQGGYATTLLFDGIHYNRVPRVLLADSILPPDDGNDTLLILNRFGGSLITGAGTIGPMTGVLYDDAENAVIYDFTGGCQFVASFSDSFPLTVPRLSTFIPRGHSGWTKFWATSTVDQRPLGSANDTRAIFGAVINFNQSRGSFNGGHNLHVLNFNPITTLTLPAFPLNCPIDV
jgi:hypothetical protein